MGDTSFDLLELCFEFQSILGGCSQFLPRTCSLSLLIQVFDLIYFIHGPGGNFLSTLCLQVESFRAMQQEQVAVKYLAQGCFGRY